MVPSMQKAESSDRQFCGMTSVRVKPDALKPPFSSGVDPAHWKSYEYRVSTPKVSGWLRTEEPQAYAQVQQILLPKDYLGYVLTSEPVTEPSVASGVGCLNLASNGIQIFSMPHISPALFPSVVESTAIAEG